MPQPSFPLDSNSIVEILQQSSQAIAVYTGIEFCIELANNEMLTIWGKNDSVIGKTLQDTLSKTKEPSFYNILLKVWNTRETFEAKEIPVTLEKDGKTVSSFFDFTYKPIMSADGAVICIIHTGNDVTERVRNRDLVRQINELKQVNQQLQNSTEKLNALNEKYTTANTELDDSSKNIHQLNEALEQQNKDLISDNHVFKDDIAHLDHSNRNLEVKNKELIALNNTISILNRKLSESDISFSNLIAQAPVAMMLLKGNHLTVTMINDAMLELIGKDHSIIGKNLFEEFPELKGQPAADMLMETFHIGKAHSEHSNPVKLKRNDQLEQRYFNFNYTPFIEDGLITGVIDMAVEVTPQVLAVQERDATIHEKSVLAETLKKSEQRLQGILDTMAEGVGVIDATGQLVYANPMAQQILGLNESAIKERAYDAPEWQNLRIDGTLLPSEEHPMSIMLATGKPVFDHEIAVQAPGRERMYISINAAPLFNEDGVLTGGIGTFMDVTARRLVMQGKEDFISIASHELKTPVTALKASLQLLERSHDKLPADSRSRLLTQAIKSVEKLSVLITTLLDAGRLEHGHIKLEKKSFTVSELFDDCCSNFAQITDQEIILEGDIHEIITADSQQIGQVMTNFITNAVKYAPQSEKIIIGAEKISNNEIKISVQDEGPGIPPEKKVHLFERYYRTNYEGQRFTGLGLGLYISADIIKKHGGEIGVKSTEGEGSTFWFTLPIG